MRNAADGYILYGTCPLGGHDLQNRSSKINPTTPRFEVLPFAGFLFRLTSSRKGPADSEGSSKARVLPSPFHRTTFALLPHSKQDLCCLQPLAFQSHPCP